MRNIHRAGQRSMAKCANAWHGPKLKRLGFGFALGSEYPNRLRLGLGTSGRAPGTRTSYRPPTTARNACWALDNGAVWWVAVLRLGLRPDIIVNKICGLLFFIAVAEISLLCHLWIHFLHKHNWDVNGFILGPALTHEFEWPQELTGLSINRHRDSLKLMAQLVDPWHRKR